MTYALKIASRRAVSAIADIAELHVLVTLHYDDMNVYKALVKYDFVGEKG